MITSGNDFAHAMITEHVQNRDQIGWVGIYDYLKQRDFPRDFSDELMIHSWNGPQICDKFGKQLYTHW